MGAQNARAFSFVGQEFVNFADGPVVGDHGEAVIVHVEDKILAHHCQTDERQIALGFRHVRCRASKKGFRMLC
jgi:hypothetical protein